MKGVWELFEWAYIWRREKGKEKTSKWIGYQDEEKWRWRVKFLKHFLSCSFFFWGKKTQIWKKKKILIFFSEIYFHHVDDNVVIHAFEYQFKIHPNIPTSFMIRNVTQSLPTQIYLALLLLLFHIQTAFNCYLFHLLMRLIGLQCPRTLFVHSFSPRRHFESLRVRAISINIFSAGSHFGLY